MKEDPSLTKNNFWVIASNSTASYVLAFLFIFYLNHFTKILVAGSYGYDLGFDWYNLFFYIKPYEWTHDSVKLIYSSGPILILVIGLISLVAFWSLAEETARIKSFFMWLALHAFNFFFGGLLIGNLFKKGIGHVFNWMYLTDTSKMVVALIGFLGLLGTALIMSKPAAVSANSYFNELGERNFPFFVTAQLIVPFVLGTLIYMGFFLPIIMFQEAYSWISLALILTFMVGKISKMDKLYFDEEDRLTSLSYIIIIATIIILVVMRALFNEEVFVSG
jgi:hypothetical protein